MARIIGVSIPFGSAERYKKIEAIAVSNGFQVKYFEYGKVTQAELDECEIFFGMTQPQLIQNTQKLKWLQASFAGVDKYVDIPNIIDNSILLTNSSGAFGITISEHIITVLLMLMRRMTQYQDLQKVHGWKILGEIKSIMNSKITIVGMGDIGQNVAKRVKAMGARVCGVRRNANIKPEFVDEIYPSDRLLDAIDGADAVILCLPDTKETKLIIGEQELKKMKSDAILINVGRGTAIDQEALLKALNEEKIGGAAIDVFVPEPLPYEHLLWNAKNIIITPHISGNMSLPLTCDLVVDIFCKNLVHYINGEKLEHIVDCKKGY